MQLTEEQRAIQLTARVFAEHEIAPFVRDWESTGDVPRDLYRKIAAVGLLSTCVPTEYGGAGADFVSYALTLEELSAVDGGISNIVAATNSPVAAALVQHGSEAQKQTYLRGIAQGHYLGCIHLTEPHTGWDAASISTRATRSGDGWVINGHKAFITGGRIAEVAMIVAVTDPEAGKRGISTFITPTDLPGYKVLREEDKLGHRTNDTCQVVFEDMYVPQEALLGEEGRGLGIALANLSAGRIGVAAQSVGGARAALKTARDYANERETFGRLIKEHQAIGFMMAEMATRIEAARQLYLHAADLHARGKECVAEASMAKLFASQIAEKVASDAIQIHGGYGFLRDCPAEKIYRDVRVYQIYEGTSEIQKLVIARQLDQMEL